LAILPPRVTLTVKLHAEMQSHRHDAGAELGETMHDRVVLVAEDNAVIGMMLADDLQDAGYAVAGPFSHAAAALAQLRDFTPDMAILDVLLKDGSCAPLARELRARGVPFIVFSGLDAAPDLPELQGVPWVVKPSGFAEIATALATLRSDSVSSVDTGESPSGQQRRATAADLNRIESLPTVSPFRRVRREGDGQARSRVRPRIDPGRPRQPKEATCILSIASALALLRSLRIQRSAFR
jgi:CheY-like chemotaxis protein